MHPPCDNLAGLVLAAGTSSRFGQPKQLYEWNHKPLVCHAVEASLSVCGAGVIVVTGAYGREVAACLQDYSVCIVHNPQWQTGMASSLRTGVQSMRDAAPAGVLVTLCDQPLVSRADLASLADIWQTAAQHPAAASYSGIVGVPAIFPQNCFDQLQALHDDQGAKFLLNNSRHINTVEMPAAAFDIDTPEDLGRLHAD